MLTVLLEYIVKFSYHDTSLTLMHLLKLTECVNLHIKDPVSYIICDYIVKEWKVLSYHIVICSKTLLAGF